MAMDPQFEKVVNYLRDTEARIGDGIFGKGQRPWLNFDDVVKAGQFDFAKIHEIFDRSESNNGYAAARKRNSTLANQLQTAKLSADFLAGFERDVRMRRRSRIRMLIHAGNRAAANGLETGPLTRNTTGWLGRMLSSAKSDE